MIDDKPEEVESIAEEEPDYLNSDYLYPDDGASIEYPRRSHKITLAMMRRWMRIPIIIGLVILVCFLSLLIAVAVANHKIEDHYTEKCQGNLRAINNAIQFYYIHNGVYPDESILKNGTYIYKGEHKCPCGSMSYVWHEAADGNPPYATCPNIDAHHGHKLSDPYEGYPYSTPVGPFP